MLENLRSTTIHLCSDYCHNTFINVVLVELSHEFIHFHLVIINKHIINSWHQFLRFWVLLLILINPSEKLINHLCKALQFVSAKLWFENPLTLIVWFPVSNVVHLQNREFFFKLVVSACFVRVDIHGRFVEPYLEPRDHLIHVLYTVWGALKNHIG